MCGWNCGDETEGHKHYAVVCRDKSGKLLGRLTPEGTATNRKLFASILSKARAEEIAAKINADGEFAAKVVLF